MPEFSQLTTARGTDRRVPATRLASGLAVLLVLTACAGRKTPKRPAIDAFTIDGPRIELPQVRRGIELFVPVGNIRVHAAQQVWLEKSYSVSASDLDAAKTIVAGATVETRQVGEGQTQISLVPPEDCPFEALAADSMLAMPPSLDLSLRTVNGLIDTRNYKAKNATLRTRDGNVLVGGVTGELRFTTDSGRVELFGATRKVFGKTAKGEIHVNTLEPGSSIDLESTSGTITVHVSPVVPIQVIFRTKTGALRVQCDDKNIERRVVPRENDWTERRVRFAGASAIAKPCLVVVESPAGDLILASPQQARPPMPALSVSGTR